MRPEAFGTVPKRPGVISLTLGVIALLWQIPAFLLLALFCPSLECDSFGVVLILAEPLLGVAALGFGIFALVRRVEKPDRGLAIAGTVIGCFVVLKWFLGMVNTL